jgi:vacuolar-type H+-ATPase subunit I/STV1
MYEYGMKFDQLYGFRVALCAALVLIVITLRWWSELFGNRELTIRSFGFALQVIGFGWILFDVSAAARKHKIPTLFSELKSKLTPNRSTISGSGAVSIGGAVVKGAGDVAYPANPTLEERVRYIEQAQEAIKRDLSDLRQETQEASSILSSRFEQATRELSEELQKIQADIREAAAGVIHLEVVSVWLFGVGSILSTFSKEISDSVFLFG